MVPGPLKGSTRGLFRVNWYVPLFVLTMAPARGTESREWGTPRRRRRRPTPAPPPRHSNRRARRSPAPRVPRVRPKQPPRATPRRQAQARFWTSIHSWHPATFAATRPCARHNHNANRDLTLYTMWQVGRCQRVVARPNQSIRREGSGWEEAGGNARRAAVSGKPWPGSATGKPPRP